MTENIKLEAGKKAPAFTLPDQNGIKVALKDYAGHWVVVYFYPKDDTPGCTKEACEFTNIHKELEKLDTTVVGISTDNAAKHQKFIEKYKLKITLLSDADRKVMAKYGAFGAKKMYGKEVQGVIRSTFLIDPKGKVAHAWYSVKAAGHADKVKEKLTELIG